MCFYFCGGEAMPDDTPFSAQLPFVERREKGEGPDEISSEFPGESGSATFWDIGRDHGPDF